MKPLSGGPPAVLRGAAALNELAEFRERARCRSVALVVDGAVVANGYAERVAGTLRDVEVAVHMLPPGEPTVGSVDGAAAALRDLDAPLVVGVGGGSAIDTAKQVAVVLSDDPACGGIQPYLLARHPLPGRRPLVAIPTTSGTGAEATRTCVLADGDGRKLWTWGDALLPDVVVLDPEATITMPAAVTTATGLDAFVHALEAVTGQRRAEHPPDAALRALELVPRHLPAAVDDGADLTARAGMQQAAFLAGQAIDGCGTGLAHSIGHAVGSLYHLPHGIAVAIGLETALAWNVEGDPAVFASAAAALGVDVFEVPGRYRRLCQDSRLAAAVAGLPEVALDPAAIADAMVAEENRPMLDNNCRRPTDADRADLAARAVAVWTALRAPGVTARAPVSEQPAPGAEISDTTAATRSGTSWGGHSGSRRGRHR